MHPLPLRIELWPLDRLVFYARNPRKNDAAVDRMVASIRRFGFKVPIFVRSSGEVVDGHLRLKAARELGMTHVPVILCDEWTEEEVKAFRLMVNRSVGWAEWDEELLGMELLDLRNLDFDLALTGFDEEEITRLLASQEAIPGLTDEDSLPALPEVPVSRLGDLWIIGRHKLLCGDSTVAADVIRLLNGIKPPLMVTDPPYGVEYDPEWRKRAGINNSDRMGKVNNDHRSDWREAWALFPGEVAYVWHGALHCSTVAESLEACEFQIRSQIIWAKPSLIMSRGHYHWQHEPCWYAVRGTGHWNGDRKQSTLWQIESRNQDAQTVHSTQKPVECMRRPIVNNSKVGQEVYDPFCGSGTTIVACETERRICLGIELDPLYVDIAVKRWQNFTGKQAALDGDGRTFETIALERASEIAEV